MRLLFLTIGGINNIKESAVYPDLMRFFNKEGHEVYVVKSIEKRFMKKTYIDNTDGVHILNVRTGNLTKTNTISKGIATIRLPKLFNKAIYKYFKNIEFDLILYSTPPITIYKVVKEMKKSNNAFTYLMLKDIFPQNAIDLGMLKKSGLRGFLYRYFRKMESKLYEVSDKIGCMSNENINYVIDNNKNIDPKKVELCPNTIDPIDNNIKIDNNKFRDSCNLPTNKKVLLYGGNFGKPQNIDFIIKVVKSNQNNDKIHFLMIGSGTEFHRIQRMDSYINNLTVLNNMNKEDYVLYLKIVDIGLIFLDDKFTIPNFPSRLLDYMNYSLPILACTDINTDVGKTIEKGEFGLWVPRNDLELYNKKMNILVEKSDLSNMGKNSKQYLIDFFTTENAYNKILNSWRER